MAMEAMKKMMNSAKREDVTERDDKEVSSKLQVRTGQVQHIDNTTQQMEGKKETAEQSDPDMSWSWFTQGD